MNLSKRIGAAQSLRRAFKSNRLKRRVCIFERLEPRQLLATLGGLEAYEPPKVSIRLDVADLNGFPIDSAPVGGEFQLRAFAQDIRGATKGVFAAYLDVTYDQNLISTLAASRDDITFGPEFENGHTVELSVPGLLDELGAFGGLTYPPLGESLLYSVPFIANAAGNVEFDVNPPEGVGHEQLVHGEDRGIDWNLVLIETAQLTIVEPGDITLSPASIRENTDTSASAVEIGTLAASAPINAASATYSLVPGAGDNDKFQIVGNKLFVKRGMVLDAETQAEYAVHVDASQAGQTNQQSQLTVFVSDLADGAAGITIWPTHVATNEKGGQGIFQVVLDSQPAADVTIAVPSLDLSEGVVSPTHVTFTSQNWNSPQMVTVTGVDDNQLDGPVHYPVITAPATSADPDYAGLDPVDVDVTNVEVGTDTGGFYRTTDSSFQLRESNAVHATTEFSFPYGPGGDEWIPLSGDWDGDGMDSVGYYRTTDSSFHLRTDNDEPVGTQFVLLYGPGGSEWIPLAGDWDGNGTDTIGFYRKTDSSFHLRDSNQRVGVTEFWYRYGPGGDDWVPIVGDWDGDGIDTAGFYRKSDSSFHLRNSNAVGGSTEFALLYGPGGSEWVPLAGDWDADGVDTIGFYRTTDSSFHLRDSNQRVGVTEFWYRYGLVDGGWIPLSGDWDGPEVAALQLAGTPGMGDGLDPLTTQALQPTVDQAIADWAAAGLEGESLTLIQNIGFVVADLPGTMLGLSTPGTIIIDTNAAGRGWFVDPTPDDDQEFQFASTASSLKAITPEAADFVDLLTVVRHELGHVLGLEHVEAALDDIMSETLQPGVRRLV